MVVRVPFGARWPTNRPSDPVVSSHLFPCGKWGWRFMVPAVNRSRFSGATGDALNRRGQEARSQLTWGIDSRSTATRFDCLSPPPPQYCGHPKFDGGKPLVLLAQRDISSSSVPVEAHWTTLVSQTGRAVNVSTAHCALSGCVSGARCCGPPLTRWDGELKFGLVLVSRAVPLRGAARTAVLRLYRRCSPTPQTPGWHAKCP